MDTISHMKFAISIFDELEEIDSWFSFDRKNIENYLKNFISGHNNVLEKYGQLQCLDVIFIREIAKYFGAIYNIATDSFAILAAYVLDNKRLPGFGNLTEECFIIYPSFMHKKKISGEVEHVQTIDAYILNGIKDTHVNPNLSETGLEKFSEVIEAHAYDVADYWTKNKNATEDEISLIADEILVLITFENKAAYKRDVIEYLAEETNRREMLRFLWLNEFYKL